MQKRKLDSLGVVAIALCCVLLAFLVSMAAKFVARRLPGETMDSSPSEAHAVDIDWEVLYPFTQSGEALNPPEHPTSGVVDSILSKYTQAVYAFEASLEAYATDDLIFHDAMVEAANAYDRALGWEIRQVGEYNGLVTLGNGYLGTSFLVKDMTRIAQDIAGFSRFCKELGIPMLYAQLPFKIAADDAGISGVVDFSNQNADALLSLLQSDGLDTLDFRAILADRQAAAEQTWHSAFFRTDHHWLPETGLWAAEVLARHLNDAWGLSLDASKLAPERFDVTWYPDWFLGSQGKKATLAVADPEDFMLLYPKEKTDLTLTIPSLSLERRGEFEVLYQLELLGNREYYADSSYTTYFYGDVALKNLQNHLNGSGDKLLVLQDSFSNALTPFLALTVDEVDAVDLRYFTGSLESLVRQNGYDGIIMTYSADLLGYDEVAPNAPTSWHNFR